MCSSAALHSVFLSLDLLVQGLFSHAFAVPEDRKTDRQSDRQIDGQTETCRLTDKQAGRQASQTD